MRPQASGFGRLRPYEARAAGELVHRVRRQVPAALQRVALFGSRARGDARPDSDVDLLFVFRRLPPDREPHASLTEALADAVAAERGVPLTAWSVATVDLERGNRTPMLVDALADGVTLWPAAAPPLRLAFTPADARFCADALLRRVEEGGVEVADRLARGEPTLALRRVRDDLLRLCTAQLLLDGVTRPRFGGVMRAFVARGHLRGLPRWAPPALRWVERSYGASGKDDECCPPPPPLPPARLVALVRLLRDRVAARTAALDAARDRLPPG